MKRILVDTNVLIDYSKGHHKGLEQRLKLQEKGKVKLYINSVIVAEFFTDKQLIDKEKETLAKEFLSYFTIIPITASVGILCGRILRNREVEVLGDALIAATCISRKLFLLTGNIKHFRKVKGIIFYKVK